LRAGECPVAFVVTDVSKQVRTNDIRAFLAREYPPESLPSVDEARKLAAAHRSARRDFQKGEVKAEKMARLERMQADRRQNAEQARDALSQRHRAERQTMTDRHVHQRQTLRAKARDDLLTSQRERAARAPKGLAAFLGRVTGEDLIRRKIHQAQHRRRLVEYREAREHLSLRQKQEIADLKQVHDMQTLDTGRHLRNLAKIETRERRSLVASLTRRSRERAPERIQTPAPRLTPSLTLDLKPPGHPAMVQKARNHYVHYVEIAEPSRSSSEPAPSSRHPDEPVNPSHDFKDAARDPDRKRGDTSRAGSDHIPENRSGERDGGDRGRGR